MALLLLPGCNRTIEEDEPPELVEHRIEPCRQWCTPLVDPECGARPEDPSFADADECVEDCAAAEPSGWYWARQEDGTDACAEEWFAIASCIDALTCEEQHHFFTRLPATDMTYPCREEETAQLACFHSTPSLEREDD